MFMSIKRTSQVLSIQQFLHLLSLICRVQTYTHQSMLFLKPLVYSKHHKTSTRTYATGKTIEYSRNFHRHVVRDDDKIFISSYKWLCDAVNDYPIATLQPVYVADCKANYIPGDGDTKDDYGADDNNEDGTLVDMFVAGQDCSTNETIYPVTSILATVTTTYSGEDDTSNNTAQIVKLFEERLKWFPSQIDRVLQAIPSLSQWPVSILAERLDFFMSPLPPNVTIETDDTIESASSSNRKYGESDGVADIDWCYMYYKHRYGAGMSLAQVYHALYTLPQLFLQIDDCFCVNPNNATRMSHVEKNVDSRIADTNMMLLRSLQACAVETPSQIFEMSSRLLHDYMTGASHAQIMAFAYLHYKGWEWTHCRIVLQALPSILVLSAEPSWEIQERGSAVRKTLPVAALTLLSRRLQLQPMYILAMLKTHATLSYYTSTKIQYSCNYIQKHLKLTNSELCSVLQYMPSILGMSDVAVQKRIDFWTINAGLTIDETRDIIARLPPLLQYSVENNLQDKHEFYSKTLSIPTDDLKQMILICPKAWTRSLQKKTIPLAMLVVEYCSPYMTLADYGSLLVSAPEFGLLNWQGNIENKLRFLSEALQLSKKQLSSIIVDSPRVFTQSLEMSLMVKVNIVLDNMSLQDAQMTICNRPKLLVMTISALQKRFSRFQEILQQDQSKDLSTSAILATSRARKKVWLMSTGSTEVVDVEFLDIDAAAAYAQLSKWQMYRIVRKGELTRGRLYRYADTVSVTKGGENVRDMPAKDAKASTSTAAIDKPNNERRESKSTVTVTGDDDSNNNNSTANLVINIAGSAYPYEVAVRGLRRYGGMAIQVAGWTYKEWQPIVAALWKGRQLRLLPDGETLLMGYPYTLASRPRCTLFACREALRLAKAWIEIKQQQQKASLVEPSFRISIHIDLVTVFDLVKDTNQLYTWGQIPTRHEFKYQGPDPAHKVNPDILYPLARSYYHLVNKSNNIYNTTSYNTLNTYDASATKIATSANTITENKVQSMSLAPTTNATINPLTMNVTSVSPPPTNYVNVMFNYIPPGRLSTMLGNAAQQTAKLMYMKS